MQSTAGRRYVDASRDLTAAFDGTTVITLHLDRHVKWRWKRRIDLMLAILNGILGPNKCRKSR